MALSEFVALFSFFTLFFVIVYLIRQTVPPKRTLNVEVKQQEIQSPYSSWDLAFSPLTPILLNAPERKYVRDASGNVLV